MSVLPTSMYVHYVHTVPSEAIKGDVKSTRTGVRTVDSFLASVEIKS